MEKLLRLLFKLALGVVSSLEAGFVLSKTWAWFIVPKFPGTPALNYLDCIGVSIVVNTFVLGLYMNTLFGQPQDDIGDVDIIDDGVVKSIITIVVVYPILLLSAYVWHQFIK